MNNAKKFCCCLLIIALLLANMATVQASNYMANTNAQIIYEYLKNTMGFNNAVCAGVLSNIRAESSFNPNSSYMEAGGYLSYGICQWNLGRQEALQNYCRNHGYDYTSLIGQLHYLEYELKNSETAAYNSLLNIPNTSQGAYDAAANFCAKFERPANVTSVSAQRGAVAKLIFEELPGNEIVADAFRFSDVVYPKTFKIDTSKGWFLSGGVVMSDAGLSSIKSDILTSSGSVLTSYGPITISGSSYGIIGLDSGVRFDKITNPGSYIWRLTATDNANRTLIMDMPFTAVSSGETATGTMVKEYPIVIEPEPEPEPKPDIPYGAVGPYDAVITDAYSRALSQSGRSSFDGWCGLYVRLLLDVMNIGHVPSGALGNGNQVYGNLTADATTSYGYKQVKYPGNNCLYDIVNAYGNNATNIVISWSYQYGYSYSNPGAGHVVFINGIIDNVVYYSESYTSSGIREGSPRKRPLNEFMSAYNSTYGNAIGAVIFTKDAPAPATTEINETYQVRSSVDVGLNIRPQPSASTTNGKLYYPTTIHVTKRTNYQSGGYYWLYGEASDGKSGWIAYNLDWIELYQENAYLDVNGWLSGVESDALGDCGTVDVYVNGNLVANDVNDYYAQHPVGAAYEIRDIQGINGYQYEGVHSGTLTGTIGSPSTQVFLTFNDKASPVVSNITVSDVSSTGYTVTCTVSDNVGVTRVAFPTIASGETEFIWKDGTISGNTATFRVNTSEHGDRYGNYRTEIYAYDAAENHNEFDDSIIVSVDVPAPYVEPTRVFRLPAALTVIGEEAFVGIDARAIVLHDGVTRIENRAFADCPRLEEITIPASTTFIAKYAFDHAPSGFTIHGALNSYAQGYAAENGFAFVADDACTVTFDANGGSCSTGSVTVKRGTVIVTLPTATLAYNAFDGWYTTPTGGDKVSGTTIINGDMTLYAHWKANPFGDWSEWSTNAVSANSNREVETEVRSVQTGTKTIYHYNRFLYKNPSYTYCWASYSSNWATNQGYSGSWQYTSSETRFALDTPVDGHQVFTGEVRDHNKYWYNETTTTEPVYGNVTYYRYRDRIK